MNTHVLAVDVCAEGRDLIDIDTACARVAAHVTPITDIETVAVHLAGGRTLAQEISAVRAMPAFDQASMDGYAVAIGDGMLPPGTRLAVVGRIAAGDRSVPIHSGEAARIFTGAPLPIGASAVVMQEHGSRDGSDFILGRMLRSGDNIRRCGEDVEPGCKLLAPGMRLDARHVALLAAQGHATASVRRRPRVGVVSTGNELVQPGSPLPDASIYDCNRPMVMTLATQADLDVVDGGWVRDDPDALARVIEELSRTCDLVVTTGGASVGEEDHSASAVRRAGGARETLRIALKPGKPAVVGRIRSATYLGLPGNPVSALVSWLILGRAAIAALEDRTFRRAPGCPMTAMARFERRPGRTEFAPGRIVVADDGSPAVEIIGPGGSARMRPFVEADGLVEIHALHAPVDRGDAVLFHPFHGGFAN